MKVKIIYDGISAEKFEDLIKDKHVVKAEILLNKGNTYEGLDEAVEEWLKDNNINGHAVSFARDLFHKSEIGSKFTVLSSKRFAKAVKATGIYITKNLRIGDYVQHCFIALDGR